MWILGRVQHDTIRAKKIKHGQLVGISPGHDMMLDAPYVYVIVDEDRSKLVAIYYGAKAFHNPVTPEALKGAVEFSQSVKDRPPETVAKASMGPVDVARFRAQENER